MTMSQTLRDVLGQASRAFAAMGCLLKLQEFDIAAPQRADQGG